MKKLIFIGIISVCLGISTAGFSHEVPVTSWPVVFAHGMGGFDDILGFAYWAGNGFDPVWDPCGFLEADCNEHISSSQLGMGTAVAPFESSEVRGLNVANQIESYMTTVGKAYVNIVGHSQGGLDLRKAAKVLRERKGYTVVKVALSISSPHRGSPVAKYILDLKPGVESILSALAAIYGDIVYQGGNNINAGAMQLTYENYNTYAGHQTYPTYYNGARVFNNNNPISSSYAVRYASLLTGQDDGYVNPALYLLAEAWMSIDGDGACTADNNADGDYDDCWQNGAQGQGDGVGSDYDSDGLVGINSQQMGYRLCRQWDFWGYLSLYEKSVTGYVADINTPSAIQQNSHECVIEQDHFDVVGVGPDTFDEDEFYAAVFQYIAEKD